MRICVHKNVTKKILYTKKTIFYGFIHILNKNNTTMLIKRLMTLSEENR